ncbi:uncharacterized protein LOC141833965 [Curcuma longa]|uniref:uncharacterized protein LOC141833965 n=1 Tax=Curcuma longa TaxID=136217 RepID=UPI003D9FA24E
MLWPDHNDNAYDDFSHDLSYKDDAPAPNYDGYYNLSYPHAVPVVGVCSGPMNFSISGEKIDTPSVPAGAYPALCLNEARRDDEVVDSFLKPIERTAKLDADGDQLGSYKRKGRATAAVPKKGRNARAKKAQKSENTCNDEKSNGDTNPQSSCCYCSEDDGSHSQELNAAGTAATALNLNRKKKACRGSATDPLSLYARKRRERINERLRILQNLIPNGTKVDISTMLEEAVQYVKFLQLQIKFLSSDELWMYAPIAYNGVNLGFDLQNSPKL